MRGAVVPIAVAVLAVAQGVVVNPFVARVIGPALAEIGDEVRRGAADLGATHRRVVLDVTLPPVLNPDRPAAAGPVRLDSGNARLPRCP